jgi:tetratricopeptide (TPR) repeat protein
MRAEGLFELGKFGESESILLTALKESEVFPSTDLRRAETQLRLGRLYKELGRLPESEKWYVRSLDAWKKSVGERDPSLVKPLTGLSTLYLENGLHGKAERLLSPWLRSPGNSPPTDLLSLGLLHNFAGILYRQGRYARAEELYLQALRAAEIVAGPQSEEVALLLNNLAVLLAVNRRVKEAGSHLERALSIWENTLPSDHPDVARALTNLAAFYTSTKQYVKAETLLKRAMMIAESRLGSESRLVGKILSEYAILLHRTKRKSQAKSLETRAEAIRQSHAPEELGRHTVDFRDLVTPRDGFNRK